MRLLSARMPLPITRAGEILPRALRSWPEALKKTRGAPETLSSEPLSLEDVLTIPTPETNAEDEACDRADCRRAVPRPAGRLGKDRGRDPRRRYGAARDARGTPIADLIAYGARADIINAVEHALSEGLSLTERVTLDGIMALERTRLECARTPVMTTVVALAHLDIAWAFRRISKRKSHRQRDTLHARAEAHHARAKTLLSQIPNDARARPFVAAARCALYSVEASAGCRQIADDYFDLIRLDPGNPRHLRALGTHLAEQGAEGLRALELEARRVAALVQAQWGAAGYAWVYFDAVAQSDAACLEVDVPYFLDGMADLVARAANQERINLLSAYCSIALKPQPETAADAAAVRQQIAQAAHWLIREHLRELHPMVWAHAAAGFDNDAQVRSLRQFARAWPDGRAARNRRVLSRRYRSRIQGRLYRGWT
ncbi:MAG: hypothetical protein EpisKO_35960 [Epibacterium sp.]